MPTFRQEFIKKAKQAIPKACSHYGFETTGGNRKFHFNDICFARWNSYGDGIKEFRLFINQHLSGENARNSQDIINYINELVNEIFPDVFRNKKYFWKTGLSFNCNYNHQYLFYIATLIRMSWENPKFIPVFNLLRENGFSFIQSAHIAQYLDKQNNGKYQLRMYYGQHGVNDGNLSLSAIDLINKEVFDETPMNKKANSFSGLFNRLNKLGNGDKIWNIIDRCKKNEIGEGWIAREYISDIDEVISKLKENLNA